VYRCGDVLEMNGSRVHVCLVYVRYEVFYFILFLTGCDAYICSVPIS
jgi:hypothetical protein